MLQHVTSRKNAGQFPMSWFAGQLNSDSGQLEHLIGERIIPDDDDEYFDCNTSAGPLLAGIWCLVFDIWHLVFGILVFGIWYLVIPSN